MGFKGPTHCCEAYSHTIHKVSMLVDSDSFKVVAFREKYRML